MSQMTSTIPAQLTRVGSHAAPRARVAGEALRSPARYVAALLMLAASVSHIPPVAEHLSEAPWVGYSFIVLAVVFPMLATLVVLRDTRLVWTLSAVFSLGCFGAYVLSRTIGLPEIGDDVGNWFGEPMGVLALVSEGALAVLAAAVAVRARRR
jgi:hypothetical protein